MKPFKLSSGIDAIKTSSREGRCVLHGLFAVESSLLTSMLYSEAQQVLTNKQITLWGSYSQELVRTDATARETPECQILKTTTNDG